MRNFRDPSTEVPLAGLEGFFDEFLTTRLAEIKVLEDAISKKDSTTVKELAHKWKGFSAPYGFGELGFLAKELEESAGNAQFERCQALYADIVEYLKHKQTQSV